MPKISDYSVPEVGAPGPMGAIAPNLEEASQVGNAIQRLGSSTIELGQAVDRHQSQQESSLAYASFAKKRADVYNDINDQLTKGTLTDDSAQQIQSDYQDFVNQQNQNYTTTQGKDYYTRQAARLGSSISQKLAGGLAHLAGQQTVESLDAAAGHDRESIYAEPSDFPTILRSAQDNIDQQVASGALPLKAGRQAKTNLNADYANTAIRALALQSPDIAKASLDSGFFAQYLDDKQVGHAYGIVAETRRASDAAAKASQKNQNDLASQDKESAMEEYAQQAYLHGGIDYQKLFKDNRLDFDGRKTLITMDHQAQERTQASDPRTENAIWRRIYSDDNDPNHIGSKEQIVQLAATGAIKGNPKKFFDAIANTPEGKQQNAQMNLIMKSASKSIVYASMAGSQLKDPDGDSNLQKFQADMATKKAEFMKEGRPLGPLYDPYSPDYLGKLADKYKPNYQEVLRKQADLAAGRGRGVAPTPLPAPIDTPPGVPPPAVTPNVPKDMAQPGESPHDFLTRKRAAKQKGQ